MGGFFGIASQSNCIEDLFFGTDYHSHLGTKRGGLAVIQPDVGFVRAIHNIESSQFRAKRKPSFFRNGRRGNQSH